MSEFTFGGSRDYSDLFSSVLRAPDSPDYVSASSVNQKFGDTEDRNGNFVPAASNPFAGVAPGSAEYTAAIPKALELNIPVEDYVNAFSPDGTHTSTNTAFEDTQSANVKKSDPSFSVASNYSLPVASSSVVPKILLLGVVGFAAYWFLLRKKVV